MRNNARWLIFFWIALCVCQLAGAAEAQPAFADLTRWVVEQMPGGTVKVRGATLEIEDAAGCTLWWREKLTAPVAISYTVTVIAKGGPHDRVSDVNCFWMANDRRSPAAPFTKDQARSGP